MLKWEFYSEGLEIITLKLNLENALGSGGKPLSPQYSILWNPKAESLEITFEVLNLGNASGGASPSYTQYVILWFLNPVAEGLEITAFEDLNFDNA